jgi:hypothetical protein
MSDQENKLQSMEPSIDAPDVFAVIVRFDVTAKSQEHAERLVLDSLAGPDVCDTDAANEAIITYLVLSKA